MQPHATSLDDRAPPGMEQVDEYRQFLRDMLGPILVQERVYFDPAGAIILEEAVKVWIWLIRDISPQLLDEARSLAHADMDPVASAGFARKVAATIADQIQTALENPETERRNRVQVGDDHAFANMRHIANGFRCHPYLSKAVAFGRALDRQRDEQAIGLSLKSFPARESPLMPMLMHATFSQIANPVRIVTVIAQLAGASTERAITQTGYAPALDAIAAHAQHQLHMINVKGPFVDMDLVCRAILRFHAMIRSLSIATESDSQCRWAGQAARMVAYVSDQLSPRLQRVEADVRQSLRPARPGASLSDQSQNLEALNGMYLLAAVREARDSLGLNSALDTAWTQTGQVLETLISRNLEAFKAEPHNGVIASRLSTAVNMARIRFNPEYADIVERAMTGAARQTQQASA